MICEVGNCGLCSQTPMGQFTLCALCAKRMALNAQRALKNKPPK
jgi:hypothetical protein